MRLGPEAINGKVKDVEPRKRKEALTKIYRIYGFSQKYLINVGRI
jgi:hypothetical protein